MKNKHTQNTTLKMILAVTIGILTIVFIIEIYIYINSAKKRNVNNKTLITTSVFQASLDKTLKSDEDYSNMPLFLSALKESCSCKVESISQIEDTNAYTANIKVTYADVSKEIAAYLEEHSNDTFDEEKINNDIANLVKNAQQATNICEIQFIPYEESYVPVFTEEIINKMYGGIYSAYYSKLEEVANSMKGSEQK